MTDRDYTTKRETYEVGTLRELNVQPGDVVECLYEPDGELIGARMTIEADGRAAAKDGEGFMPEYDDMYGRKYRIISRANAALPYGHARLPSGAVVDLTAITTPFGLLDAETQEALLAHGGPWQHYYKGEWQDDDNSARGVFRGNMAHWIIRVAPQPPAPVIGEVLMYTGAPRDWGWTADNCPRGRTHSLTLPTRDGQLVPGDYTGPDGLTINVVAL